MFIHTKNHLKLFFLVFILLNVYSLKAQNTTVNSGSWSTASNWSTGVAPGASSASITYEMTGTSALNMGSGTYTYDFNANTTFSGSGNNFAGGAIIVESGVTLTFKQAMSLAGTSITIQSGGTLIVYGNITNDGSTITDNGSFIVNGSYAGQNNSAIVIGTGTFTTTGSMTCINSGTIFGNTNVNCSSGCNANTNICGIAQPTVSNGERCNTGTVTLTPSAPSGVNFKWYTSASGGTAITMASSYSPSVSATTNYYVSAVTTGGCETPRTSVQATVNTSAPAAGAITGPSTICVAGSASYSISPVTGATGYAWSTSGLSSITSGQGTTAIVANILLAGTISVKASNSCGSGAASSISVALGAGGASAAGAITGSTSVCVGQSYTYSTSSVSNATSYTWAVPTGASITSGTGTTSVVVKYNSGTGGTVSVTPINTCGNGAASSISVVASSGMPSSTVSSITGSSSVCIGTSNTYSITSLPSATSYTWSVPSGSTISSGSTSNSITLVAGSLSGTISVTPVNGCGNDVTTQTLSLTINPNPNSTITANGSLTFCSDSPVLLTALPATSYLWSTGATTQSISATTSGSYTVKVTDSNCSTTSAPTTVTVNALPSAPTATGASINCQGSASLSVSGGSGTSYNWYTTSSGGTSTAGATYSTPSISSTTTYYVTSVSSAGCESSPRISAVATVTPCSINWTGTTNTDWATSTNWSTGYVPTSINSITIPSSVTAPHQPVIGSTTTAVVNSLSLSSNTSSLTLNSGSALNIYGNFTNSGTVTDNGGTTTFEGASAQTYSGPAGGTNLSSLTLNNSSGLTLSAPLTVTGILTLSSGTITTGGNLTVNLYKGGISGTGTGLISGNLTVTKKVDTAGYHYIAEPIPNCVVSDIDNALSTSTEYFGSLYWYDETNTSPADSIGWTGANNATNFPAYPSLTQMQGFALYFFSAGTLSYTKTYATNNYTSTRSLTSTVSGNASADGWNLVGNPYPSSIDWNASSGWTKTGIDNAVYYYNPATHNYASYVGGASANGGTNIIPSVQAFWVHVTTDGGSGTLGVTNSVRSTAGSPLLWRAGIEMNYMNITVLSSDSSLKDQTVVRLLPEASASFDPGYDAYKMMSDAGYTSLYSQIGQTQYSVNTLSDTMASYTLPLYVGSPAGSYSFTFADAMSIQGYDVFLTDSLLHMSTDVKQNTNYAFTLSETDTVSRFFLNFRKAGTTSSTGVTGLISATGQSSSIIITNDATDAIIRFINPQVSYAGISLIDMLGREVWENDKADISSGSFVLNGKSFASGVYVVKVVSSGQSISQKVIFEE